MTVHGTVEGTGAYITFSVDNITFVDSDTTQAYVQTIAFNLSNATSSYRRADINGADAISYQDRVRITTNEDGTPVTVLVVVTLMANGRPPRTYYLYTLSINGSSFAITYMNSDGNFAKSDYSVSGTAVEFSHNVVIPKPNYNSLIYANPFGQPYELTNMGPGTFKYNQNTVAAGSKVDVVPTIDSVYVPSQSARLEINRGANGKSFQYDGGSENTSASYMLEIPTTGRHELTYNGVEPGLTEISVEVQNSEEIDVGYNDTWTSAPTTLTLTPSADTVTLRSNMQLTVTSENENIMDTITVNNEPQVTPYTGTITGTQNIVLKPTPPEITINYEGTSTPVISDT